MSIFNKIFSLPQTDPDLEYKFNPQPDITAYELALILSCQQIGVVCDEPKVWYDTAPPTIQRHFKRDK